MTVSSRLSGFYNHTVADRAQLIADQVDLTPEEMATLADSLSLAQADKMIENVIGRFTLPFGVGANFRVNQRDYLIPMVVEEPSVVAAVSNSAKVARGPADTPWSGFRAGSTEPIMIAQVQLLDVPDPAAAEAKILAEEAALLKAANTSPSIAKRGGGPRAIQVRQLPETPTGPMTIVHLHFDCRDAMGANAVNTAAETIAPMLEQLSGGRALLRILSNLTDERRAWAEVLIPAERFTTTTHSGVDVIQGIADANAFAVADPYRATTHNKGILNGIDAVALATGNDWRAIESGAHAYAARDGQYRALTDWRVINTAEEVHAVVQPTVASHAEAIADSEAETDSIQLPALWGRIELPLSVGIVGGATRSHPSAQIAMKILDVSSAQELSEIMAAVGLAQNLAAIRALATEGIQRGHMGLHARQIAVAAGAEGTDVDRVAAALVAEGQIRVERAKEILETLG